jgi:hypothetical protein
VTPKRGFLSVFLGGTLGNALTALIGHQGVS